MLPANLRLDMKFKPIELMSAIIYYGDSTHRGFRFEENNTIIFSVEILNNGTSSARGSLSVRQSIWKFQADKVLQLGSRTECTNSVFVNVIIRYCELEPYRVHLVFVSVPNSVPKRLYVSDLIVNQDRVVVLCVMLLDIFCYGGCQ